MEIKGFELSGDKTISCWVKQDQKTNTYILTQIDGGKRWNYQVSTHGDQDSLFHSLIATPNNYPWAVNVQVHNDNEKSGPVLTSWVLQDPGCLKSNTDDGQQITYLLLHWMLVLITPLASSSEQNQNCV